MSRMSRAAAALLVGLGLVAGIHEVRPSSSSRGETSARSSDRRVGLTEASSRLNFSVMLRPSRPDALARFVEAVQNTRSNQYRHFLDAAAFGRRFGPPAAEIAHLEGRLRANGLRVLEAFPQRTALDVQGTARDIGRFFRVPMAEYVDRRGRRYHAPLRRPRIPSDLRGVVDGLAGLNSRPIEHKLDVPRGGVKPADLATAYHIRPLWSDGLLGQRQTVAIFSILTFDKDDVAKFDAEAKINGPPVQPVTVAPPTKETDAEAALDIDTIRGLAPKAQILNYQTGVKGDSDSEAIASFGHAYGTVIDRIVKDNRADIVSVSYGACDVPKRLDGSDWLPPRNASGVSGRCRRRWRKESASSSRVETTVHTNVSGTTSRINASRPPGPETAQT